MDVVSYHSFCDSHFSFQEPPAAAKPRSGTVSLFDEGDDDNDIFGASSKPSKPTTLDVGKVGFIMCLQT